VVGALGRSASSRLAKFYAMGNYTDLRVPSMKLVGLGALLGVAVIMLTLILAREILTVLFKLEYADYVHVMVWTMATACISYMGSFLGHALIAVRYFRAQVPLYAFVAGITPVT